MCWLLLCSAGWMVLVFIIGGLPLLLVIVGIILGSSIAEEDLGTHGEVVCRNGQTVMTVTEGEWKDCWDLEK